MAANELQVSIALEEDDLIVKVRVPHETSNSDAEAFVLQIASAFAAVDPLSPQETMRLLLERRLRRATEEYLEIVFKRSILDADYPNRFEAALHRIIRSHAAAPLH